MSEDPLQTSRRRQTRACSRPNRLAFVPLANKTARHWPPRRGPRSVRDAKISISRARRNSAPPPLGFLLGRLSNAGPLISHDRPRKGRRPKPFTNCDIDSASLNARLTSTPAVRLAPKENFKRSPTNARKASQVSLAEHAVAGEVSLFGRP